MKKPVKYCDVLLTHVEVHAIKPSNPTSWYEAIIKAQKNKKPGRIFTRNISSRINGVPAVIYSLPPRVQQQMEEAKKSGKTIRLLTLGKHLPIYPAKDMIEKISAERKKNKRRT